MTTPQEYLVASDSSNDYADAKVDALYQDSLEAQDDLYNSAENRDEEIWDEMDVEAELVVADYDEIDDDDRDLAWVLGLAGIAAAAATQYFLDKREQTILAPLAYREQVVGSLVMSREDLLFAAKRGFDISGTANFAAMQAQYTQDLAFIRSMSNKDLYSLLSEVGAIQPAEKAIASQVGYVSRMTNYRSGSPQFKEAVANLIDTNSKRGLKAANRRAVEKLYTYREVDGDMKTEMVWVVEASSRTCSYCQDRSGMVKTYENWIIDGLPGADVCKGADLCNCHLAAI